MKFALKTVFCLSLVFMLTIGAFAIEKGDYGYYDTTSDGKIDIVDVLNVIKQVVNDADGGSILRAVQTLNLVTEGKLIYPAITAIENDTVHMTLATEEDNVDFSMPINRIGFDANYDLDFYIDGVVTMTASADFETAVDVGEIYAAEASIRYDTVKVEMVASEIAATVNGEAQTLIAAPFVQDGVFMADYSFLAEKLEATTQIGDSKVSFETAYGETVMVDMLVLNDVIYVPAAEVATALGAKVTYDSESETLVFIKQFVPLINVTNAVGKASDEVAITFSLTHNPGIAGLQINVGYDSSIIDFVSATTVSNGMYASASQNAGANPVKIVIADLGLKNTAGDLELATAVFKIADDAPLGSYILSYKKIKIYDKDIYGLKYVAQPVLINVE